MSDPLADIESDESGVARSLTAGLARCEVAPDEPLLVAVSGGVDSMVLLHALVEIGRTVGAVHVDHGLRHESAADAAFVLAACRQLGVPALVATPHVSRSGNRQSAARDARYRALRDAGVELGVGTVVVAHTATDQAETVLMALARGTGLRGLAGMPQRRSLGLGVQVVRPLLGVSRAEVEDHAAAHRIAWREDPGNADLGTYRARVRHQVLPALRDAAGVHVDARIARSAANARDAQGLIGERLPGLAADPPRIPLDVLRSKNAAGRRALLAEAWAQWSDAPRSRALVARLAALVDAPVGTRVEAGGLRVWRERDALRFECEADVPEAGRWTATPLDTVPTTFPADPWTEIVDADRVGHPVVRRVLPGDRIRPLGLDGRQRVADLLQSRGVPRADRRSVPVVADGDRVLWVVGHRLAASVAVTPSTTRAALWTWHRGEATG